MKNANVAGQTDIFSVFGITDEYAEQKKREEEEKLKRQEEMRKRQEELKKNAEANPSSSKPAVKKEEPFEVNHDTFIYHLGQHLAITDYFSTEEIENGLPSKKKTSDGEDNGEETAYKKITGEDVRKRLEKDFPDLVAAYTDMVYIKQKNMVMAVPKAKKKGLNQDCIQNPSASAGGFVVPSKIPFGILQDFIALSKQFQEKYGTELHGDIYLNLETKEFFMDIPHQIALRTTVERNEDPYVTAQKLLDIPFMKVMEIHSHHEWAPIPSMTDDQNERQGSMLYAIVGKVHQFFPEVTVRYFNTVLQEHIPLNPFKVFENPFTSVPSQYDVSVVEVWS